MSFPAPHPLGPRKIALLVALASALWTSAAAAQADPDSSDVDASPVSVVANGSSTSTITVTLRTALGTQVPIGGDTVTLSTTLGTISGGGVPTDNNDGTYTATITSVVTGTATITGTVNGSPIADDATVTFTAGPASGATSTIVASPTSIVANGSSTSAVTVTLRDANGNPLTIGGDTVVLNTTAGSLGSVTDNGNGTYTATLTSSTTAGTATITGTVNGGAITDDAVVTFTAGPASGATSTIAANPTSIVANGSSTSAITVTLRDANSNPLTTGGDTVVLNTTAGSLGSVTDNGNGTYSATLTSSTTAGTATITGTVNGSAIADDAVVTFTAGGASGATSTIVANPTSIVANGSSTSAVTVTLRDANGNALTSGGDTVVLNTTAGSLGSVTDNGNGTYSATLTSSTTTGTATITGTVNGSAIADNAVVTFTAGPASGATSTIDASPATIVANGSSTSGVTVTLRDANGNPLTTGGDTVVLNTTAGSLGSVTDNGNGTYSATLTSSTTAGTATITGTVNGGAIADDATVTFIAGSAGSLDFQQQPTTTASGATITPAVTVRATDSNGNTDTSFTGAITLTIGTNPGGGTLSGTTTVNAVGGVATFSTLSIDAAGAGYTLVAEATGLGGDISAAFDIVPGPASGANSLIDATPTVIPADGSSTATVTVTLVDANGNPLTTGGDTVVLSTTLGSLGSVVDNGNGTYTAILTSTTAVGTATISGTVNGAPIADDATVDFVAGNADELEIIQQPSTTDAGVAISPPLQVRAIDDVGNTVTSFSGAVSVAIGNNPGAGVLTGTTTVNAVNGVATFSDVAINQPGSGYTLIFSSAGFLPVTTIAFTITGGGGGTASPATSTITANPTAIPANGASVSTITVQLRDAAGANLTSGGDTVTLSTAAGALGAVIDNGNGTYTATLTSSASPATAVVSGTVNGAGINDTASVIFTAGGTDLEVTVSVDEPSPTIGATIVYTITVSNLSGTVATGVELTDDLPARLRFVSADPSQGTFDAATGVWQVGELAPLGNATLSITAEVRGSAQ